MSIKRANQDMRILNIVIVGVSSDHQVNIKLALIRHFRRTGHQ
jgi:hypothetical protein